MRAFSNLWRSFWQLSTRERALIITMVAIPVLYVLYFYGIDPLWNHYAAVGESLTKQKEALSRKEAVLVRRGVYEQKAVQAQALRDFVSRSLLPGDKPELASARMQTMLRDFAREANIELERINPATPKVIDNYTEITITLPFRCYVSELRDFLYQIETSEYLFHIGLLDIRVPNPRKPDKVRVNLEVTGYTGKPGDESEQQKEAKEKKDVKDPKVTEPTPEPPITSEAPAELEQSDV